MSVGHVACAIVCGHLCRSTAFRAEDLPRPTESPLSTQQRTPTWGTSCAGRCWSGGKRRDPLTAHLLLRSTAYNIIQTSAPSAVPRLGMLRNLYRLLAPPSAHTIYRHRTRAGVINYWRLGADVLWKSSVGVSLPTPSERTRKNGPLQPEHAIWFPLVFAQSQAVSLRNVPDGR
jgi:hypothetical protein